MPIFTGFSTQNVNVPSQSKFQPGVDGGISQINVIGYGKKFKLTDEQLVIQDFINALNIPMGQKPGQPSYGTTLWSFLFEPNVADVQVQIQNEIRRMAKLDPRITLGNVKAYPQDNGILLEVELTYVPTTNAEILSIFFNQQTRNASYV